jgi:uncharacterized membrane protein YkoI
MMKSHLAKLPALLFAALLAVAASSPLLADDDDKHDHELARQALVEGRIKSLAEITAMFRQKIPGEIVGVELDRDKKTGAFVYEFKILTQGGHLKEADVDAANGAILKIEEDDD